MKKWKQGSYTVEAAFIMGILISLLLGILYLSFYLHNKVYLQNAAYEIAFAICLNQKEADLQKKAEVKTEKFIKGRLLGRQELTDQVKVGERKAEVNFQGRFQTPGMVIPVLFEELEINTKLKIEKPSEDIIRMHGIRKWSERE